MLTFSFPYHYQHLHFSEETEEGKLEQTSLVTNCETGKYPGL